MYGNFRPLSRICFYHSPPCNTTTQEQQRVKFNTLVERERPWTSNIIYTFGANTKPLGAKVWGKTDNNTFQQHRAFRYLFCLRLTFWFWTLRCGSFICFPMISLRNRKCVTDRRLNSLLMRTAFCRGGGVPCYRWLFGFSVIKFFFFPYLSSSERVKNSNSKNRSREPQIHKMNTE